MATLHFEWAAAENTELYKINNSDSVTDDHRVGYPVTNGDWLYTLYVRNTGTEDANIKQLKTGLYTTIDIERFDKLADVDCFLTEMMHKNTWAFIEDDIVFLSDANGSPITVPCDSKYYKFMAFTESSGSTKITNNARRVNGYWGELKYLLGSAPGLESNNWTTPEFVGTSTELVGILGHENNDSTETKLVILGSNSIYSPFGLTTNDSGVVLGGNIVLSNATPTWPSTESPNIIGTVLVGETLTANVSTIDDTDVIDTSTFGYQWMRDNNSITTNGANSQYTLVNDDAGSSISVVVTLTDIDGVSGNVTSHAVSVPPRDVTVNGTPTQNEQLTAVPSGFSTETLQTLSYEWSRLDNNGAWVVIGNSVTYTPIQADVNHSIRVVVSWESNSLEYSMSDTVENVNDIPIGTIAISGELAIGKELTIIKNVVDADGYDENNVKYKWEKINKSGVSATITEDGGITYTITQMDAYYSFKATMNYIDYYGYEESVPSSPTDFVDPLDVDICIMEGQDVLLDKGYTKIEDIQAGDTINGSQVYKVFKQPAGEYLVKFPKDCFGLNVPNQDVYVTHNHMVIDPSTGKLNNAVVYTLLNKNVKMVEPPKEFVYNILMKEWGVVTVNNMKCESLCPFMSKGMNELIAQGVHDESFRDFVESVGDVSIDDISVVGSSIMLKKLAFQKKNESVQTCNKKEIVV